MKPSWKFCLTLIVLLTTNASPLGRSEGTPSSKTITVCRIEYTALGKQANWHFNYTYVVKTNEEGSVENVRNLEKEKRPSFVNEDKVIDCIKTWKLSPSGKHVVLFSIGTNGVGNSISVVDPNRDSIKLVLQ